MPSTLLIDFGASHTKAACLDDATQKICSVSTYASLKNCAEKKGHFEISAKALHEQFEKIVLDYSKTQAPEKIMLCSQMHGFLLVDEKDEKKAITDYISWQDERALEAVDGVSTLDFAQKEWGDAFLKITGMRLRAGLAFLNVLHWCRSKRLQNSCKIMSLPDRRHGHTFVAYVSRQSSETIYRARRSIFFVSTDVTAYPTN